jgi:hypothetical protein
LHVHYYYRHWHVFRPDLRGDMPNMSDRSVSISQRQPQARSTPLSDLTLRVRHDMARSGHMNGKHKESGQGHVGPASHEQIIQVLSLEYRTLRDELLTRTSGRFQFLGLMTTAAALLIAGIGGSRTSLGIWPSIILAIAVLCLGLGNFFNLGRDIARISARISLIEQRINSLLPNQADGQVLSWESENQRRSLFTRLALGQLPHRQ